MAGDRPIVLFCMPLRGHIQRTLPLIAGLSRRGRTVLAFTDARFRSDVEGAGGTFIDLFSTYPIEAADATSEPIGCRFVTYAGHYAEPLLRDLLRLDPSLILHDTFAVIGAVLGHLAGLPYVNICAGHNRNAASLARHAKPPSVVISPDCRAAVARLRSYGFAEATPFFHLVARSPYLNVYCEPPEFLSEEDRVPFEPVAFFGSLSRATGAEPAPRAPSRRRRIYVSLGTVARMYYAADALAALKSLSAAFAGMEVDALFSLGGWDLDPAVLSAPNVRVERYLDQWNALRESDLFVTHHGLNSTHEAIYHRVPMISYPILADQPLLAKRCQQLGLAVPLVPETRGAVTREHVSVALARVSGDEKGFRDRLSQARQWELDVIGSREAVLDRILTLAAVTRASDDRAA